MADYLPGVDGPAMCNIQNMHNDAPMASDVLAEAGITTAEVRAMRLTGYDALALRTIRKARALDPIVFA